MRPVILGFSCMQGCGAGVSSLRPVSVRPDGTLKIRGRNLSGVRTVLFAGGAGRSDDVRAEPSGVGRMSIDVSVPSRARSGPIVLLASNLSSSPSRQRLIISEPRRGGDGGDDDDDDRGGDDGDNDSGKGGGGGAGSDSLAWPVPRAPIYGAFGENRGSHVHAGIDISARVGTPVKAAGSGRVLFAGPSGAYGNYVCVAHASVSTCYAHLGQMLVSAGDSVSRGQVVGYAGMTGNSSGPHLHFEVRNGTLMYGLPLDPGRYLPGGVPAKTGTSSPQSSARAASVGTHRHHQD
jgi:murein DD-endopeptidase MepM/ murein hydrolase activator NlpD